jgi:hypothetical protein
MWVDLRYVGPSGLQVGILHPLDTALLRAKRFLELVRQNVGQFLAFAIVKQSLDIIPEGFLGIRRPGLPMAWRKHGIQYGQQSHLLALRLELLSYLKGHNASKALASQEIRAFWLEGAYFFDVVSCHVFNLGMWGVFSIHTQWL